MKDNKTGIFFIVLLAGVLLTILICVMLAKKDVDEFQEMQETISANQEQVDELDEELQNIRNETEEGYEQLDLQIGN